jgi:tetratricopeptide (TPR) repeat protein
VVAPFGLLGMALALRRWRRNLPLLAMMAVYLATNVVFFTLSRYRAPAVPVLIVFAAFASVWLFDAARARAKGVLAAGILAVCGLAAVVHLDVMHEDLSAAYYNLGNKYRTLGEYELAVAQYDRSLEINRSYISAHNNRALALEGSARPRAEAVRAWQIVRAMGEQRGLARYVEIADRHLAALAE